MMKLLLAFVFLLTPALSLANSQFPFNVYRGHDGKIETIELGDTHDRSSDSDDSSETREKKRKLEKEGYFHLLAAPNDPDAFQARRKLVSIGGGATDVAKIILDVAPVVGAASSILSQHVRNLEARRAFFQNALLVYLDHTNEFSSKEKSLIRSSIFYSRIGLLKDKRRAAARASWSTYGDKKLRELYSECAEKNEHPDPKYGVCFKVSGSKIKNLAVDKGLFRSSAATAYNFDRPDFVKKKRYSFMAAKTGSSFLPIPGLGFLTRKILNSMFENQRRTEGFLYGQLVVSGELSLAERIRETSANPTM